MIAGIVDTTVIIHLFRKDAAAMNWVASFTDSLAVTSITWLEMMYGAGSKSKMMTCKAILDQFECVYMTQADQEWAMQKMEQLRLSYGVAINDCFIASIASRLEVPLYTHNIKDMLPLLKQHKVIKPY